MTEIKFNFKKAEEAISIYKEDFEPGVHDVKILGVGFGGPEDNKKPFISIRFTNMDGTREHLERFYVTESAIEKTLGRLKHLIKNAVSDQDANADRDYSIEELNRLLAGKQVRLLFVGEERPNKDNVLVIRTKLKFFGFAEPITVPREKSLLVFRPERDIKKFEGQLDGKPEEVEFNLDADAPSDDNSFLNFIDSSQTSS